MYRRPITDGRTDIVFNSVTIEKDKRRGERGPDESQFGSSHTRKIINHKYVTQIEEEERDRRVVSLLNGLSRGRRVMIRLKSGNRGRGGN